MCVPVLLLPTESRVAILGSPNARHQRLISWKTVCSQTQNQRDDFGIIQAKYIYCALFFFYYYYIRFHLRVRHWLSPGRLGPLLSTLPQLTPLVLVLFLQRGSGICWTLWKKFKELISVVLTLHSWNAVLGHLFCALIASPAQLAPVMPRVHKKLVKPDTKFKYSIIYDASFKKYELLLYQRGGKLSFVVAVKTALQPTCFSDPVLIPKTEGKSTETGDKELFINSWMRYFLCRCYCKYISSGYYSCIKLKTSPMMLGKHKQIFKLNQ